jgi:nitrogen PTS system EIIA component
MALIDLITTDVIKVPLTSTDKTGTLRELAELLHSAGKIPDPEPIIDALQKREALGSTGLESGIAVPHCKTSAVKSLTIAIGISPKGIDFDALDGEASSLFFCILAPPDQSGPHIEALSEIARLARSQSFCRVLKSSNTPDEVIELFRD